MIPTPKIKVKVPQKLFYPAASGEVRIELMEAVIGMDAEVWRYLTAAEGEAGSKKAASKVDTYLEDAQQDADTAWKTLCGEVIYFIRARKQNAKTVAAVTEDGITAVTEDVKAASIRLDKPLDEPRWLEPPGQPSPSAGYVTREACRDEDWVKAQTVALYAAWRAENSDFVQSARGQIMAGQLIQSDELISFLSSPALRILNRADLAEKRVAVYCAFSRLEGDEPVNENGERTSGQDQRRKWTIYFSKEKKRISRIVDNAALTTLSRLLPDSIHDETSHIQELEFLPGSVFEELLVTAQHLTFSLLRCTILQALAFLLTGRAPVASPIDALWLSSRGSSPPVERGKTASIGDASVSDDGLSSIWKRSHVSLTVPLWLSADVAEQAFRRLQREVLGAENRPFKPQNVQMFYFVLCERRRMGVSGPGTEGERRQIWSRWNELCQQSDLSSRERTHVERERTHVEVVAPNMPDLHIPDPLSGLEPEWTIESFTYFNTTCNRIEERIFPSFF